MNATQITAESTLTTETLSRPNRQLGANPVALPTKPALDSVLQAICLDAKYDSLRFVLRSDTGHDGE
jgi:hypothetical protein